MKRLLGRLLFGRERIPQYVAVGLADPQEQISVFLHGMGQALDVTRNNVAASLRPFRIAICLPAEPREALLRRARLFLSFGERLGARPVMGTIRLRFDSAISLGGDRICIFETRGETNACLPPVRLRRQYVYQWLRNRRNRDPYNFRIIPRELPRLFAFYICPRPVALITVQRGEQGNMFPMDLIGPTSTPFFLLALRTASPSVDLIKECGRIALSRIPVEFTSIAYELGKHHKVRSVDWGSLPFETIPSATFGLRTPAAALGVAELNIAQAHTVGSHTLFVALPVHDERRSDGLRMFHVQGFYQDYLKRAGRPLMTLDSR